MYTHLPLMSQPPTCPWCHATLNTSATDAPNGQCRACGQLLLTDAATSAGHSDELEGTRIARIVNERRAIARTRGYCIVLLAACAIVALQLLWYAIHAIGTSPIPAIGYAAAAIILIVIATDLRKRVIALGVSLSRSSLTEPTTPPDFTALSDGSQRARNLDNITDDQAN